MGKIKEERVKRNGKGGKIGREKETEVKIEGGEGGREKEGKQEEEMRRGEKKEGRGERGKKE